MAGVAPGQPRPGMRPDRSPRRPGSRREQPLAAPTTCIYSKSDGIVAWQCCTSLPAPLTENIEVRSSHLGYGHNLETLSVIADRLAQPEGRWRPMHHPKTDPQDLEDAAASR